MQRRKVGRDKDDQPAARTQDVQGMRARVCVRACVVVVAVVVVAMVVVVVLCMYISMYGFW